MIKEGFWWLIKIVTVSVIIQLGGYDKSAQADTYPVCVSQLEEEVNQVIERPEWRRSRWGILVRTLDESETLYNLEGDKYFLPASNLKLLTTAAALEVTGSM
jgi:D-alanyl-D-alanine carboxypeptidase/D-alanyl-D-alanine-endopeptidase (penicillin-binding protein 4)